MKSKFTDFLKEAHAKDYTGTDDDMPDAFESWLMNLPVGDFIELGDKTIEQATLKSV
jgi:hypothetical protein